MTESFSSDQNSSNDSARRFKIGDIEARIDPAHVHRVETEGSSPVIEQAHPEPKQAPLATQSIVTEKPTVGIENETEVLVETSSEHHDTENLHRAMRIQATELAEHLQSWQSDLDRRNEQIRTQFAELDNERRSSQLTHKLRYDEFQEQKSELEKQRIALQQREETLIEMEKQNESIAQQLFESQQQVASERATLHAEREEFRIRSQHKQQEWALKRHEFQNTFRSAMGHLQRRRLNLESEREELLEATKNERHTWAALKAEQKSNFKQRSENLVELEQSLQTQHLDLQEKIEYWQQKIDELTAELVINSPSSDHISHSEPTIENKLLLCLDPAQEVIESQSEQPARSKKSTGKKQKKSFHKKKQLLKQMKREVREMMIQSIEAKLATEQLRHSLLEEIPEQIFQERLAEIRDILIEQYRETLQEISDARSHLASESEKLATESQSLQRTKVEQDTYFKLKQTYIQEQLQAIEQQQRALKKDRLALEQKALDFSQQKTKLETEVILLKSKLERMKSNPKKKITN